MELSTISIELEIAILLGAFLLLLAVLVLRYALLSCSLSKLKADYPEKAKQLIEFIERPLSLNLSIRALHTIFIFLIAALVVATLFISTIRNATLLFGIILLFLLFISIAELLFSVIIPPNAESIVLKLFFVYRTLYSGTLIFFMPLYWLVKKLLPKGENYKTKMTENDLLVMVEEASKQGVLEEDEKEMITGVFELSTTTAHEIMKPRLDIVAVELKTPLSKVVQLALDNGYSRLPVYKETIDKIVGIILAKDLIAPIIKNKKEITIKQLMRKPLFIPHNKKIDEILRDMQETKMAMAIVVDEYGGTDGLITMEDVIEEIVGDISDEYDHEVAPVQLQPDGSFIVDGKATIEDVNEELGSKFPEDDFETIGGYIYGLAGRIPSQGEVIDAGEASIKIEQIVGNRITSIRIIKKAENSADESTAE